MIIKIIFGVGSFLIGLSAVIAIGALRACAIWMDGSFRWGGGYGDGI